ncbi:hypothetical protein CEXT_441161 [Caerostris extrusa]|uniref:Uncharacterized protein n=1 Tax=Caerostris extrusa TaxID=172846 RepID=A0AAV4XIF5_CAEEX|nr:hypothetical protein CEXT_441161 [Caerostris extrusa]
MEVAKLHGEIEFCHSLARLFGYLVKGLNDSLTENGSPSAYLRYRFLFLNVPTSSSSICYNSFFTLQRKGTLWDEADMKREHSKENRLLIMNKFAFINFCQAEMKDATLARNASHILLSVSELRVRCSREGGGFNWGR